MTTDHQGCSTCPVGEERWERCQILGLSRIQYDYRRPDGRLFSCVAKTLDAARAKRDQWEAGL